MDETNGHGGLPVSGDEPNWEFGPHAELTDSPAPWLPPSMEATESPAAPSSTPSHRTLKIGLALAAAAALAGAAIGHFAWTSGASSTAIPERGAQALPPSQGSDDQPAGGAQGASNSAATAAVTAQVSPSLVDINTVLGYQSSQAAGTGIVLSSDGLVLTNNHVIAGSTKITATDVGDGKTYTAIVVGYDRSHDIAVLKLQSAHGLQVASFGSSGNVAIGQSVIGIGNAGGKGGTPSAAAGTVTGLNQSITASDESASTAEELTGLIQTDAAIQPGDSGGPLVDMAGRVLGVDTAASSTFSFSTEGAKGFAVPADQALPIAHQIIAGHPSGTIHLGDTAFLGVKIGGSDGSGSLPFNDGSTSTGVGARISVVVSGSPAAQSGLAEGDTITAVDGSQVTTPESLTSLLFSRHPGEKVSIGWTDSAGATHHATMVLATGPTG